MMYGPIQDRKTQTRIAADITHESLYLYSRHTPLTNPHLSPPRCKRQYQVSALLTSMPQQDTTYRQRRQRRPPTPRRAGLDKSSFVSCGSLLLPGSPMADSRPHAAGFVEIPPEAKTIMNAPCHATKQKRKKRPLSQQGACMPCRGHDHV